MSRDRRPRRIVCLSSETVEVLYALGAQERIVGISGYSVFPAEARRQKPKVFAFSSGDLARILAVAPDLVLTFSNLQADIGRDLVKSGVPVMAFNQHSVDGILDMVDLLGRVVGEPARAAVLIATLEAHMVAARQAALAREARVGRRPRVYFEEWDEPLISGIGWVSELIELAGGVDCFSELAAAHEAGRRIIADPAEVVRRAPDLIVCSWCGKRFRPERVAARPGWQAIPAVAGQRVSEIKSAIILSPGPVAIRAGLPALGRLFDDWASTHAA